MSRTGNLPLLSGPATIVRTCHYCPDLRYPRTQALLQRDDSVKLGIGRLSARPLERCDVPAEAEI